MVIFRCCLHQFQLHLGLVKNLEDSRPQKSSSLQVPTLLGLQAWAWAQQAFGAGAEIWTRILPVVEQRHLPSHLCVTCFSPYVFQLSKSVGRGEREKLKAKSVIVCSRCTNPIPKRKHIFVQTDSVWANDLPKPVFKLFILFSFLFLWAIAKFPLVDCAPWQHPRTVPAELPVVGVGYLRNRNALDYTDLIYSLPHFIETLMISILPE